ncbi:MAG: hypothetical protein ACI9G9_001516 [Psychromonas sp.]|jgi:hypothetical protein
MPMLKKYIKKDAPTQESKLGPSIKAMQFIINYSKSLEVTKGEKLKAIYQLN